MSDDLDALLDVLAVEHLDTYRFRGTTPTGREKRVYGGQVLAQAMHSASCTVDDRRRVHSLHAYFLRPGDPARPILYEVDPIRDGRRFSTRRVIALQAGRAIFSTSISYKLPEEGLQHQDPMPDVPGPDQLESDFDFYTRLAAAHPERYKAPRRHAVDYRIVEREDPANPRHAPARMGVWMRANGTLAENPATHTELLAYMSDNYLLSTALLPHALVYDSPEIQTASIDHALWFYGNFRADEWLYYHLASPCAAGGRGFNIGSIYTRDGRLIATAVQEGLMHLHTRD